MSKRKPLTSSSMIQVGPQERAATTGRRRYIPSKTTSPNGSYDEGWTTTVAALMRSHFVESSTRPRNVTWSATSQLLRNCHRRRELIGRVGADHEDLRSRRDGENARRGPREHVMAFVGSHPPEHRHNRRGCGESEKRSASFSIRESRRRLSPFATTDVDEYPPESVA